MPEALIDPIVAHCFLEPRGCKHTVAGFDPNDVHRRLEQHYAAQHQAWIDALLGGSDA